MRCGARIKKVVKAKIEESLSHNPIMHRTYRSVNNFGRHRLDRFAALEGQVGQGLAVDGFEQDGGFGADDAIGHGAAAAVSGQQAVVGHVDQVGRDGGLGHRHAFGEVTNGVVGVAEQVEQLEACGVSEHLHHVRGAVQGAIGESAERFLDASSGHENTLLYTNNSICQQDC